MTFKNTKLYTTCRYRPTTLCALLYF